MSDQMSGQHGKQLLLEGGYVLTMAAAGGLPAADVLIHDGRIQKIGRNLAADAKGAERIDVSGKVVMPGLIDNHWHMWQGLVPGVSCDDTFGEYFARALDGLGVKFTPEDTELGVLLSALAGLNAGKTTVVDWNHGALTPGHVAAAIRALERGGVRAIEAYGPPANTAEWFNSAGSPSAEDVRQIFREHIKPSGLVQLGLAIRGPEFSSMDRVRADVELARELGIPVTMHAGIPGFFQKTNSPQLMEEAGLLGGDITFVHCNAMTVDDFKRIQAHGAHTSASPEVEMQMGFGRSPLGEQLEAGLRPTVSVDVPTAIGADVLLQARIGVQRQREQYQATAFTQTGQPLATLPIKARDVLAFVTSNAAASIGMEGHIGTLETGKQADIIVLDLRDPDLLLRSPAAAILQAAHPGNITDVFVAGRARKRNGRLTVLSEHDLQDLSMRAQKAYQRLSQ